jgi:DNA-binding response OmpR family regulator
MLMAADDEPRPGDAPTAAGCTGHRMIAPSHGGQALVVSRQDQLDVIVLDIIMPRMDGLEFIRRFRKEAQVPIILLTARVDESDKVVGFESGADDRIIKPFHPAPAHRPHQYGAVVWRSIEIPEHPHRVIA